MQNSPREKNEKSNLLWNSPTRKVLMWQFFVCLNHYSDIIYQSTKFFEAIFTGKLFQTDLCLTLVPFDLSVLVWGVFCAFSRGDLFGLTQVLI